MIERILPIENLGFSIILIGARGININLGSKGTYLNTGIPGTGFYSRKKSGKEIIEIQAIHLPIISHQCQQTL